MGGLSAAVIGGPMTMTFIALESTGDLWLTTAVLIAVIISSQLTRELFGYSFATWRFHLRGETIRSAADVGWMRDLTVGKMMRHDVRTVLGERRRLRHFARLSARLAGLHHRRRRAAPLCRHGGGGGRPCGGSLAGPIDQEPAALYRRHFGAQHVDQGGRAGLRSRRGRSARGRQFLSRPARHRAY